MLDDDDKLELMESITLKGMGGDDALIEVSLLLQSLKVKFNSVFVILFLTRVTD